MPNLFEPEWDDEVVADDLTWRRARLGRQAGGRQLGASLFEVPAGGAPFPLHIHHANEELLVVLSGRPTLRTIDGASRELAPGEVVALPAGRAGGHAIDNLGDETARWLVVSTMHAPEVNEFPERGTFWVRDYAPGLPMPDDALDVDGLRPG